MTAEAERALQSFRMIADSRDAVRHRIIEGVITGGGGRDKLADIAEKLSEPEDPEAINAFARHAMKARTRDKPKEIQTNAQLSGPKKHAVNIARSGERRDGKGGVRTCSSPWYTHDKKK